MSRYDEEKHDYSREATTTGAGVGELNYRDDGSSIDFIAIEKLKAEEAGHDIKLRTMSWKKTAALLFGDQVCMSNSTLRRSMLTWLGLAIMAQVRGNRSWKIPHLTS